MVRVEEYEEGTFCTLVNTLQPYNVWSKASLDRLEEHISGIRDRILTTANQAEHEHGITFHEIEGNLYLGNEATTPQEDLDYDVPGIHYQGSFEDVREGTEQFENFDNGLVPFFKLARAKLESPGAVIQITRKILDQEMPLPQEFFRGQYLRESLKALDNGSVYLRAHFTGIIE